MTETQIQMRPFGPFGHENQQISNFVPELTWLISGTKFVK